jgi:hypothetical protein
MAAAAVLDPPEAPAPEERKCMVVPVEVKTAVESANGWEAFSTHIESLVKMFEKYIWPVDPEADLEPTQLPFAYATASGEEDEAVLRNLMIMLTLGLQGEAFKWRYKFDFDVVWDEEHAVYRVWINSVRRMHQRGLDTLEAESTVAEPVLDTPAASTPPSPAPAQRATSADSAAPSADFSALSVTEE